jgi:hypothetical protein
MAEDLRRAAGTVPGVTRVELCLADHMYAETINAGIREGRSFQATFGDEADGEDLGTLRRRFRTKAFLRRQEVLLRHLLDGGWPAPAIAALSREALAALPLDAALVRARDRYLEIRDEIAGPGTLAFVTDEGAALDPDRLAQHLAMLRRVTANMVFNGALCRGLLRARYGEEAGGEPTLYDFAALRP